MRGWRIVTASVKGPGHARNQDRFAVRSFEARRGQVVALALADGASAARHGHHAAAVSLSGFLRCIDCALRAGGQVSSRLLRVACVAAQRATRRLRRADAHAGDYAATFLAVVISPPVAWAVQVGDGAIAIRSRGHWRCVFPPDRTGYVNATRFLIEQLPEQTRLQTPERLVLFSDGFEPLALVDHPPGVAGPLLDALTARRSPLRHRRSPRTLARLLGSSAVRAKSEDDITLLLAAYDQ